MIKISCINKGLATLLSITIGFVSINFSQSVFAKTVFQNDYEVNNADAKMPAEPMPEAAPAEPMSEAAPAFVPGEEENGISTSKNKFVDKWDLNKMCLGNFCLDDPIGKHGGFKAFKQNRQDLVLKPLTLDCEGYSISIKSIKQPEYSFIEVTPSPQYQEKGINNYYRITSIYVHYPKISTEDVQILTDKIVKRAGGNYDRGTWVNPNNPGEKVNLFVEDTSAKLDIYERVKVEEYKLLQKQTGCLSKTPNL